MLKLFQEKDVVGQTVAQYTMGMGLESMRRGEASSFYHYDALGSTQALTDGAEEVTDTYRFNAWGEVLGQTGTTANPHTYVGRNRCYATSRIAPPPLPNLDFKIEAGDSLLGPTPGGAEQRGFREELVRQYRDAKAGFLVSHGNEKHDLRQKVDELRGQVADWTRHGQPVEGFDWEVDFAEVFAEGGFDIVAANPPYVRMELFKEINPTLRRRYVTVHTDRADLYVYFYARSIELLKDGGMLVFISSDKWLRAHYGAKLRNHIANVCHVESIIDFGELPVFQRAATFPMVIVACKGRRQTRPPVFAAVKSLEPPYPDLLSLLRDIGHQVRPDGIRGAAWTLTTPHAAARLDTMRAAGIPLREYVHGHLDYGIKTGFDKAFVIDGDTRRRLLAVCPESERVIKPTAHGNDVRRWGVTRHETWLLYMHHGVETRGLDPVLAHLRPHRAALEARATRQKWYELQQPAFRHPGMFEEAKIVYPEIAKEPRFALDTSGFYPLKTVVSIPTHDLFLLGVLNSSSAWEYLCGVCSVLGDPDKGGRLTLQAVYVGGLPIPDAPPSDRSAIEALVDKCLHASNDGRAEWEREIDERVAALYGL